MYAPYMRISDQDREAAAARLGAAMSEGRLDIAEYSDRVGKVYAAKTYRELDELFVDLQPQLPPMLPGPPGLVQRPLPMKPETPRAIRWTGKFVIMSLCGMLLFAVLQIAVIYSVPPPGMFTASLSKMAGELLIGLGFLLSAAAAGFGTILLLIELLVWSISSSTRKPMQVPQRRW